jgi:hypothetical protein
MKTKLLLFLAPTSVGEGRNKSDLYFAYGFVVSNGWIVQNSNINGYSGAFGCNLSNGVTETGEISTGQAVCQGKAIAT